MKMVVWLVVKLAIVLAVAQASFVPVKECLPTFVDCYCGPENEEYTIQLYINTTPIVDGKTGKRRCVAIQDAVSVCELQKCTILPNDNFYSLFVEGVKHPISNTIEDFKSLDERNLFWKKHFKGNANQNSSASYPIEYIIFREGSGSNALSRKKRASAACQLPELKNVYLKCWKWPHFLSCEGKCIYGHAMETGPGTSTATIKLSCRHMENRWKPHQLSDCQPYLNCKTKLSAPGHLRCSSPTDVAPFCDISCMEYDDKPEVETRRYTCDDNLNRKLPHCAEVDPRGEALVLQPPPDV